MRTKDKNNGLSKIKFFAYLGSVLVIAGVAAYLTTSKEFYPSMLIAGGVYQHIKALCVARFEVNWNNKILKTILNN